MHKIWRWRALKSDMINFNWSHQTVTMSVGFNSFGLRMEEVCRGLSQTELRTFRRRSLMGKVSLNYLVRAFSNCVCMLCSWCGIFNRLSPLWIVLGAADGFRSELVGVVPGWVGNGWREYQGHLDGSEQWNLGEMYQTNRMSLLSFLDLIDYENTENTYRLFYWHL